MIGKGRLLNVKVLITGLLISDMCAFSGKAQTSQVPIEQQILQITSAAQTQTIFNSASPADQITIIGLLPGVVNRFKVNLSTALPIWLNNIATQGINSSNSDVAKATISQIGRRNAFVSRPSWRLSHSFQRQGRPTHRGQDRAPKGYL